jgi:hypothetical protein
MPNERSIFLLSTPLDEECKVDDRAVWIPIRVVFWSILLFVAIRLVVAMVFTS